MAKGFLTPIDLNSYELRNATIQVLASAPSSPGEGRFYYDSTLDALQVYDGSAWRYASLKDGIITSGMIANGAITNDDINASAGIALSKLATDPLARANHTGTQTASTISDFNTAVQTNRLDQMAAPTAAVSLNSQKITNLGTPTAATDAATKAYVDAARSGLDVKQSVRAGSTANVAITYNATGGTSGRGQITAAPTTLDGVSLAANDRLILKDQSTGAQNGIWVVTTLGSGSNGVWDRAEDFDSDAEVTSGAFFFITEGTTNGDNGYVLTTNDPITIGGSSGTALTFAQFSGAGAITAGAGLLKTGSTLDIVAADGSITVNSDSITVGLVPLSKGGTNATDAAGAKTNLGFVGRVAGAFSGSAASYAITHSLGTRNCQGYVYRSASPYDQVEVDIEHTDANTMTFKFGTAPSSGEFTYVIVG